SIRPTGHSSRNRSNYLAFGAPVAIAQGQRGGAFLFQEQKHSHEILLPQRLTAMKTSPLVLVVVLGLGMLSGSMPISSAQQADPREGPEVLASGPVPEAYAEPVSQSPPPAPVGSKPPPDPIAELPPEQKPEGDNVQWLPGYWNWDEDRQDYIWVSGFWRTPPPDRQWVPGHWQKVEGGWQWSPGFWNATGQSQLDYLPPP